MNFIDYQKSFMGLLITAVAVAGKLGAEACDCEQEEDCPCEEFQREEFQREEVRHVRHHHFSNQDVNFYEQTPGTVYKDSDWPSNVQEYSDYLSR